MRVTVAHNEKAAFDLAVSSEKRIEAPRPRARAIRLDRHIRQAEWAERLQGRF